MKEFIERAALLNEFCRDNCERQYDGTCHNCRMTDIIADFPATDVVEVRHGRWVDENKNPIPWDECNSKRPSHSAYCSECGEWLTGSDEYPAIGLYCPNCGARMDGKEADHD